MWLLEQLSSVPRRAFNRLKSSSINARREPVLTIWPGKPVLPFKVHTALRSTG